MSERSSLEQSVEMMAREQAEAHQAQADKAFNEFEQRRQEADGKAEWLKPKAFEPLKSHSKPYPINVLPDVLHDAVLEINAHVQAPVAMAANAAIAVLSLAAQTAFTVRRDSAMVGPVGLYLLTIAESGERKTALEKRFLAPISEHEKYHQKDHIHKKKAYEAELATWEAKKKGLKAKIAKATESGKTTAQDEDKLAQLEETKPQEPKFRKLNFQSVTIERLRERVSKEWPSMGLVAGEGGRLLGGYSMKDNPLATLASLNSLWDGTDVSESTKKDGDLLSQTPRLTVSLQVQQQALDYFDKKSDGIGHGIGFFARFLTACPPSTQGTRFYKKKNGTTDYEAFGAYIHKVRNIVEIPVIVDNDTLEISPIELSFDDDAYEQWIAFHDRVELQLGPFGDYKEISEAANKIAENCARLAALLHIFDNAPDEPIALDIQNKIIPPAFPDDQCVIDGVSMESAITLSQWYLDEALRIRMSDSVELEKENQLQRLDLWLINNSKDGVVTVRYTQQHFPCRAIRKNAKVLRSYLGTLAEMGRIRIEKINRKETIVINPALLNSGDSA